MLSHNFSIYGEYAYCLNTNELVSYMQNNTFIVADKNIFYPDNYKHYFIPAPFQEEVIEWLWNEHKIGVEIPIFVDFFNYTDFYFRCLINCLRDDKVVRDYKIHEKFKCRNKQWNKELSHLNK